MERELGFYRATIRSRPRCDKFGNAERFIAQPRGGRLCQQQPGARTTVADGTIDFGGPFSPGIFVHGPSILQYTGSGETTDRVINLLTASGGVIEQAGTGLLKFTSNVTGRQDLSFAGSTSGRGEFAGVIDDIRVVSKFGTGTWTLSAANTYTGQTSVFDGTLLINGNQSAATGAVFCPPSQHAWRAGCAWGDRHNRRRGHDQRRHDHRERTEQRWNVNTQWRGDFCRNDQRRRGRLY